MIQGKICLICDILNTETVEKCVNCGSLDLKLLKKEEIFNYEGKQKESSSKKDSSPE